MGVIGGGIGEKVDYPTILFSSTEYRNFNVPLCLVAHFFSSCYVLESCIWN